MSPTTVTRPLQVADLFCGAGGFSTAVLEALGEDRVNLVALNHWDRAIATHNANHSGGERADLYDADPLTFVPGGELDLLVASPTCTFFSGSPSPGTSARAA